MAESLLYNTDLMLKEKAALQYITPPKNQSLKLIFNGKTQTSTKKIFSDAKT